MVPGFRTQLQPISEKSPIIAPSFFNPVSYFDNPSDTFIKVLLKFY